MSSIFTRARAVTARTLKNTSKRESSTNMKAEGKPLQNRKQRPSARLTRKRQTKNSLHKPTPHVAGRVEEESKKPPPNKPKKKRIGRPPAVPGVFRDKKMTVGVSVEEQAAIRAEARRRGISISELFRTGVFEGMGVRRPHPEKTEREK